MALTPLQDWPSTVILCCWLTSVSPTEKVLPVLEAKLCERTSLHRHCQALCTAARWVLPPWTNAGTP